MIWPFENRRGWRRLHRGAEIEPTSSLVWVDVIRADFQTVISHYLRNIIVYLFCAAQRLLRTIFMQKSKPKYACLPSKIVKVWNRAILHPLWLMTSAAADVISDPSVIMGVMYMFINTWIHTMANLPKNNDQNWALGEHILTNNDTKIHTLVQKACCLYHICPQQTCNDESNTFTHYAMLWIV